MCWRGAAETCHARGRVEGRFWVHVGAFHQVGVSHKGCAECCHVANRVFEAAALCHDFDFGAEDTILLTSLGGMLTSVTHCAIALLCLTCSLCAEAFAKPILLRLAQ